jgi:hypothetical protein
MPQLPNVCGDSAVGRWRRFALADVSLCGMSYIAAGTGRASYRVVRDEEAPGYREYISAREASFPWADDDRKRGSRGERRLVTALGELVNLRVFEPAVWDGIATLGPYH